MSVLKELQNKIAVSNEETTVNSQYQGWRSPLRTLSKVQKLKKKLFRFISNKERLKETGHIDCTTVSNPELQRLI